MSQAAEKVRAASGDFQSRLSAEAGQRSAKISQWSWQIFYRQPIPK
jgi:hypothetical protein